MTASVILGLALGVGASVGTHVGWLIKHRGAQQSPTMDHRHPLRSVRDLFASRCFTVGMVIATVGGLLHLLALALAPISVVQAVMAVGLIPLAVAAQRGCGHRLPGRQWAGVALTAAGLLLFAIALPNLRSAHNTYNTATMIIFNLTLAVLGATLIIAAKGSRLRPYAGALLGAGSGQLFGLSDLAVKAAFGVIGSGALQLILGLWLTSALIAGIGAQYVSARSLQLGDVVSVTALTGLAVNAANILGGITIFGDPLSAGTAGTVIDAVAFLAICAGAFLTPAPDGIPRARKRPPVLHAVEADSAQPQDGALARRLLTRTPASRRSLPARPEQ